MSHRQTRIERAAEGSFPHWVAINAELCTGPNFERHRDFCHDNNLEVSQRYSPSVVWEREWYVVLRFAKKEHADLFIKEFGGEGMHPSEKGRGKHWMRWKKGTYKPKPKGPYDFSRD